VTVASPALEKINFDTIPPFLTVFFHIAETTGVKAALDFSLAIFSETELDNLIISAMKEIITSTKTPTFSINTGFFELDACLFILIKKALKDNDISSLRKEEIVEYLAAGIKAMPVAEKHAGLREVAQIIVKKAFSQLFGTSATSRRAI
jgi:hypothetical protein